MTEPSWEERMAIRAQAREAERMAIRAQAREAERPPDPDRERFVIFGPDDSEAAMPGICTECFEWRPYPSIQAHFGWCWWRTCDWRCQHEHHADEIWIAGSSMAASG